MGKLGRANILIASVQVPFTRGGAEILAERLRDELEARDFCADIIQLPLSAQPKDVLLNHVALWRGLDLRMFHGKKVDLVIATKFPSYMLSHPQKLVWLVHQHRQIYDLYGSRFGDFHAGDVVDETLRQMLMKADIHALRECRKIFTISENVQARLKRYLDLEATVLTPPLPLGNAYRSEPPEDYILSVGRICSIKRVDLIVKALPKIIDTVKLKIVGQPDEPAIDTYLRSEIDKHHLWHRIEFLGRVSDERLLSLFAKAFAVFYAPYDEDYGFVSLEALASGRPVVTAIDSGGVLAFIQDEHNGLVVEPNEEAIARAVNRLYEDADLASKLRRGASHTNLTNSWDEVIENLTSPLFIVDEPEGERDGINKSSVINDSPIPQIAANSRLQ